MIFNPSAPLTLGVELEFQLLDPETLSLVPKSSDILALAAGAKEDRIKEEFIQSMVEVNTRVCDTARAVQEELARTCRLLERIAREAGCMLFATSLHPFSNPREQLPSPGPRYRKLRKELQEVGVRLITQGLHVHVGVPDGQSAIKAFDNMRALLPIFLALTTSSPYFQARDTGLHSYRSRLFEALPRTGVPEAFGTWERYRLLVESMKEAGSIRGIRDIWWDVRPHPDFGTIETRICDLPCSLDEIVAVASLIQASVKAILDGVLTGLMPREMILCNKWQAVRYGLKGWYVGAGGRKTTLSEAASELLDLLRPVARELGGHPFLSPIRRVLSTGTSADRQRRLYGEHHSFSHMIRSLRKEFWT